jgi:hypothetical protein
VTVGGYYCFFSIKAAGGALFTGGSCCFYMLVFCCRAPLSLGRGAPPTADGLVLFVFEDLLEDGTLDDIKLIL